MSLVQIAIDARNPGEYLAVCGLLELVHNVDPESTSRWKRCAGIVPDLPAAAADVCEIEAKIDEHEIVKELALALRTKSSWKAVTKSGRVPLEEAVGVWTAGIEVWFLGQSTPLVIDHWYERAFVSGSEIVQRHGKRDGKSRWKFWAGQQDRNKGITGLMLDLVTAAAHTGLANRFQDLLGISLPESSRLNLDAAATRSSIDRGISANDAAATGGSLGRPFLELLGAVGLSAFFPPRRVGDAAPDGTVGINGRLFRYCTWSPSATLSLARLCARGVEIAAFGLTRFEAAIGMMGQYSYLKFARSAGTVPTRSQNADLTEEEDIDE